MAVNAHHITDSSKLGLQNADDQILSEIKADISQKLEQQFKMGNSDAIIDYIIQIAVKADLQKSELISQLSELFPDVLFTVLTLQQGTTDLVHWFFTTLGPKYQSKVGQSIIDDFNDANNSFNEELQSVELQKPSSSSFAKNDYLRNISAGGASGKLLSKANQEASKNTTSKIDQQKKVISLQRSNQTAVESDSTVNKGDVFDRLLKKRPVGERVSSNINVDLDTLIKKEGFKNSNITGADIHKRVKKGPVNEQEKRLEEIKFDPNSSTVIDLSIHKNNIRQRTGEKEEAGEDKKKTKCRHWPNCNYNDEECQYFHPKDDCPYFPKCQFGEKCIYIHPDIECKFGYNCTRSNCSYKHPKGRMVPGAMNANQLQKAMLLMMAGVGMMGAQKPKNKKFNANHEQHNENPDEGNETASAVQEQPTATNE